MFPYAFGFIWYLMLYLSCVSDSVNFIFFLFYLLILFNGLSLWVGQHAASWVRRSQISVHGVFSSSTEKPSGQTACQPGWKALFATCLHSL